MAAVVCVLLLPSFAEAQKVSKAEEKFITLSVGVYHDESLELAPKNLSLDGTFRDFTSAQFDPSTKTLRLNPKKEGLATINVKNSESGKVVYKITLDIRKTDLQKVAREIQSLLQNIEGISIRILNNKVAVDGQILLPSDMKRIHSVVKQYGNLATSLVTLSPMAQNKIAQFIEKQINNPEIQVSAVNGKFILNGWASDNNEKTKAEILAKMYVPDVIVDEAVSDKKVLERKADVVINLINVRPAPAAEPDKIIQLVVHYVELQKDYSRSFRIQWTPDLGESSALEFTSGGRSPGGLVASITGTISNLLPKLNWAREHGMARVLQSSTIIVEDKKQGVLNSTTRIPYQVVNFQGQPSTNFEETGFRTTITPRIMGAKSDSIQLDMDFNIRALISISDQGPLTSSRELKSSIHVRSGASAAVGGLISNESGTNYNKLPPNASRNPILSLYASKDFRRNQSQFIVFITPIIKSSASAGADKIKQKFRLPE